MNLERLNKLRLLSALSDRFKDLKVLREEKAYKKRSEKWQTRVAQTVPFFGAK